MRFFFLSLTLILSLYANQTEDTHKKYTSQTLPKKMSIKIKKERFFYLVGPAVKRVHTNLIKNYLQIKKDMQEQKNQKNISKLKKIYRVKSDHELLLALKPHPQSIALAQAALESAWGTSRFFLQANNIFGMWSVNPHEPRIAAGEQRGGKKTIYLKKLTAEFKSNGDTIQFDGSYEDSIYSKKIILDLMLQEQL